MFCPNCGKYTEDGCYSGSLGCNGIGAKLTTYLSSWLVATTWNNNKFEKLTFKDGLLTNREVGEDGAVYFTKENMNLANLIDKLDKTPREEIIDLGKKAKARVESEYTWEKIVYRYEKLFDSYKK